MMRKSKGSEKVFNNGSMREIDWELRPGGLLVQKRTDENVFSMPMIKIKVSHGSSYYDLTVPAQSTFGDLKRVLTHETGLEPNEQRLLFRGKEKEDDECLHMAGVKDTSKVILLEDPASRERKLEEMKKDRSILKAYEAVSQIRAEVDKLSEKVVTVEMTVSRGAKVAEKEFVVLTELLMVQLLKLDTIDADGEAKVQRRTEVHRVQNFIDTLDNLRAINSNPFCNNSNVMAVNAKWKTVKSGVGSLGAPTSSRSSAKITQDWELFD